MPHGPSGRDTLPEGPIETPSLDSIRTTPYNMPPGFTWGPVPVTEPESLLELYKLLTHNYVEDDDALFRFDYSPEFLVWALTPPGWRTDFLVGVYNNSKQKKLVAFISGVPTTMQIHGQAVPVVEINFLCVHKKLRSKRLAPVLIKEITRRANLQGIFQAVYTAGTVLPVPVSSARYYHRSLHPKKLVSVGFSRLPPNGRLTLARMCKMYQLPSTPVALPQLRPMTVADVPQVTKLLQDYFAQHDFSLHVQYTPEEVAHWFLPRPGVMDSYVAETEITTSTSATTPDATPSSQQPQQPEADDNDDDNDGGDGATADDGGEPGEDEAVHQDDSTQPKSKKKKKKKAKRKKKQITDFISFYHLPSSILNQGGPNNTNTTTPSEAGSLTPEQKQDDYSTLYAAYSYYNIATTVSLQALLKDALILAKQRGADVFNALDLMDNDPATVLEPLKFGIGDGQLQYYIYNWSCPVVPAKKVGLVLL